MQIKILALPVFLLSAFTVSHAQDAATVATPSTAQQSEAADNNRQLQLLNDGAKLVAAGKSAEAIGNCFDKVIDRFQAKYGNSTVKIYSAGSPTESLMYMAQSANNHTAAKVVAQFWAMAFYLKSYALIDLHRPEESLAFLEKAIELSPRNSQFLAELGNRYSIQKNWPKSLDAYQQSEAAAREFSSQETKSRDLGRALRGLAFVYVEQGRLDDAEINYRKCLELDSADAVAARELNYVRGLKAKMANALNMSNAQPYTHAPTATVFPIKLGSYQLGQVQDMEVTQPGRGTKINYLSPDSFSAEITVFNAKMTPVPNSAKDPVILNLQNQEVESLMAEAKAVPGLGTTLTRKTVSMNIVWPISDKKIDVLVNSFIVYPQGRATNEDLYIWIAKGYIWEARVLRVAGSTTSETPINFLKSVLALSTN